MAGQPPNWATVAQASNNLHQNVQTITQELSNIQNVGNIQLANAVAALTQRVTQGFEHINDRLDVIEITLEEMEERGQDREERSIVRSRNAGLKSHEEIEPILVNGQAPNNFPHTVGQLATLSGPRTNHLLHFYGLPIHGNLNERRKRLARFLGVFLGYCLADDNWVEAVKFLDLGDGAGWELLQAMLNADYRQRPIIEAVLNHRFMTGALLF